MEWTAMAGGAVLLTDVIFIGGVCGSGVLRLVCLSFGKECIELRDSYLQLAELIGFGFFAAHGDLQ